MEPTDRWRRHSTAIARLVTKLASCKAIARRAVKTMSCIGPLRALRVSDDDAASHSSFLRRAEGVRNGANFRCFRFRDIAVASFVSLKNGHKMGHPMLIMPVDYLKVRAQIIGARLRDVDSNLTGGVVYCRVACLMPERRTNSRIVSTTSRWNTRLVQLGCPSTWVGVLYTRWYHAASCSGIGATHREKGSRRQIIFYTR